MLYYLQLTGKTQFEQVSEYVFKNRKHALNDEGGPRYTDCYVTVAGEDVQMVLVGNKALLSLVCRMLQVREMTGTVNGGIYVVPSHIPFSKANSNWLYEVMTGNIYKRANKIAA